MAKTSEASPLFADDERQILSAIAAASFINPFSEERLQAEELVVGRRVRKAGSGGVSLADAAEWESILDDLNTRLMRVLERRRSAVLEKPKSLNAEDAELWRRGVQFAVFHRFLSDLDSLVKKESGAEAAARSLVREIRAMFLRYLPSTDETKVRGDRAARAEPPAPYITVSEANRLAALFFQLRRAFHYIFRALVGSSASMGALRAQVWEAAVTNDLDLYSRALIGRMRDFSILILGESGTGKELVARAIGLSQFIAWDEKKEAFAADYRSFFLGCNIAEFAETLLESELFGYMKGSFTGAVRDHAGLLETCPPGGVVFLDEIGDLPPAAQVKLLRVLQTRKFSRVGSRDERAFEGRILSATHRSPGQAITGGSLREDFLYRLASSTVRIPPLRQRIAENEGELRELAGAITSRVIGIERSSGAGALLEDTQDAKERKAAEKLLAEMTERVLPPLEEITREGHQWPGNVREMEQAIRALLLHGNYEPTVSESPAELSSAGDSAAGKLLGGRFERVQLTLAELRDLYCRQAYEKLQSFQAAGDRLGVDWRTIKTAVQRAGEKNEEEES